MQWRTIYISDQYRREAWNKSKNERRGSDQHSVTALNIQAEIFSMQNGNARKSAAWK